MTDTERLERIAHLVYEWGDMMTDGPDDSDVAMAYGWLTEAFGLAREHRRAKQPPSQYSSEPPAPCPRCGGRLGCGTVCIAVRREQAK